MANSIIQFHSLNGNSLYVCNKAERPQSHTHSMVPRILFFKKFFSMCQDTIRTKYFKPQNVLDGINSPALSPFTGENYHSQMKNNRIIEWSVSERP